MRAGWKSFLVGLAGLAGVVILGACGSNAADKALRSDANGFLCLDCGDKFYTGSGVFADHCPACQSVMLEQVIGFVCPGDGHVTLAGRGAGRARCGSCGKGVSQISLPKQVDFEKWGAKRRDSKEVTR